jgi:hypothetical protein
VASKLGGRKLENDCRPENTGPRGSRCVGYRGEPTHVPGGEGRCAGGRNGQVHSCGRRDTGPSIQGKTRGDNVGNGHHPAGAGSNLQRPADRGTTEGGGRVLVGRMSQYERRRRGYFLPGGLRGHPRRGNASKGQRGSRRLVGIGATPARTQSLSQPVSSCVGVEPSGKPERPGVYAGQRLSFGPSGKARWGQAKVANRTREIRLSGMKTGARGNVAYGGTRNPPRRPKGREWSLPPTGARAPDLSKRPRRLRRSERYRRPR